MSKQEALKRSLDQIKEWPEGDKVIEVNYKTGKFSTGTCRSTHDDWQCIGTKKDWLEAKAAKVMQEEKWQPEIGQECEAVFHEPEGVWFKAILLSDLSGYVGRWLDGPKKGRLIDFSSSEFFRPLKTQEEVEREEGIKALTKLLSKGVGDCEPDEYLATVIWDEGYRK